MAGTEMEAGLAAARARLAELTTPADLPGARTVGLAALAVGRLDLARAVLGPDDADLLRLWTGRRHLRPGTGSQADARSGARPEPSPPSLPGDRAAFRLLLDPEAVAGVPIEEVAGALCSLVFGVVGARPDAPYGRLHLVPRFPGEWQHVQARNLHVGDARVELGYRRKGPHHTFTLRQRAGRMPVTVVFQPWIQGRVARVLVDGEPAQVTVDEVEQAEMRRSGAAHDEVAPDDMTVEESEGGRARLGLQLPVDRERTVTVEGAKLG